MATKNDIIVVFQNGAEKKMTREEYEKNYGVGSGPTEQHEAKKAQEIPPGYVTITWSNVGDILLKTMLIIQRHGKKDQPTPEDVGLDNTVIGLDGYTNYSWVMREAYKLLGGLTVEDGAMV